VARGLLDYSSDWGSTKSPKGSEETGGDGGDYQYGNPYRAPMPETESWGLGPKGYTSYGHSEDVVEKNDYKSWGLNRDDVARGYTSPKSDGEGGVLETRQKYGSNPQSIPENYKGPGYDRGAGSDSYANEHSDTTGRGFDGRGQPKSASNPGGQSIGSRENLTS
jgi:hypothetical protein